MSKLAFQHYQELLLHINIRTKPLLGDSSLHYPVHLTALLLICEVEGQAS